MWPDRWKVARESEASVIGESKAMPRNCLMAGSASSVS